jgi:dTDP-4-dehydrorhamnose 3,5-epimerase
VKVRPTRLPAVLLIEPQVRADERGFFLESWREDRYAAAGLPSRFVQDNHSRSVQGTVRGLHYQLRRPQGKLVRVVAGAVLDVAADIRRGSPTFGQWVGETLSAANQRQLYVPPGFAHGFAVLEGPADLLYKCTDYYDLTDDRGVRWDDPTLAIEWCVREPLLSPKDANLPLLSLDRDDLPVYDPRAASR